MGSCKDCMHYEVCCDWTSKEALDAAEEAENEGVCKGCDHFKPSTDVVKVRADAITEFAERLKKYYNNLKGKTSPTLTAYHIDQIKQEMLQNDQKCE